MSIKSFIQILILFFIIFIVGIVYFKYFESKKNVVEEINLNEDNINNQILELEKKVSQLQLKNNNLNKKLESQLEKENIVEESNILNVKIKKQEEKDKVVKDKINESTKNQGDKDELYQTAVEIIKSEGKASTSFLQRKLQIGYNRAARIIDMMEADGIVSKANHVGKRDVL